MTSNWRLCIQDKHCISHSMFMNKLRVDYSSATILENDLKCIFNFSQNRYNKTFFHYYDQMSASTFCILTLVQYVQQS